MRGAGMKEAETRGAGIRRRERGSRDEGAETIGAQGRGGREEGAVTREYGLG
jgi:hypothetical protein